MKSCIVRALGRALIAGYTLIFSAALFSFQNCPISFFKLGWFLYYRDYNLVMHTRHFMQYIVDVFYYPPFLVSLSGMVETPRLQAKKSF